MIPPRVVIAAAALVAVAGLAGCAPAHSAAPAPHHARPTATPAAHGAAPSPAPSSTAVAIGPSGNALDAAGIQDIHDAISSGNTAALEQRFAPQVHMVTTDGKDEMVGVEQAIDATQAVETDLSATWNWSLPSATLAGFRATRYGPLFPTDAVVGQSSDGEIISFTIVGSLITAMLTADSAASVAS